jgi:zinc finger protein
MNEKMADTHDAPKPDGKAFDDFFDSLGNKVDQVGGAKSTGPAENAAPTPEEGDERVVDEIESLCMNCHENVSP